MISSGGSCGPAFWAEALFWPAESFELAGRIFADAYSNEVEMSAAPSDAKRIFLMCPPLIYGQRYSAFSTVSIAENGVFCNRRPPVGRPPIRNDLRLFVLRLDPFARLAHFADDQVVAEAAPYQIIEESLRLLGRLRRAFQSHVFADGAVDQLLFALLFISFVERIFNGFGRKFFAPEVAPQPRSAYRLRR